MIFLKKLFSDEMLPLLIDNAGATAIEYGLICALLACAVVASMQGLGASLSATFNNTSSTMATNAS